MKTFVFNCVCHNPFCKIAYFTDNSEDFDSAYLTSPIFHSNKSYNQKNRFKLLTYLKRIAYVATNKEFEFVYDVILKKEDAIKLIEVTKERISFSYNKIYEDEDVCFLEPKIKISRKMLKFFDLLKYIANGSFKKLLVIYWYKDEEEIKLHDCF